MTTDTSYDDLVTFGRVMTEVVWQYDEKDEALAVVLDYFENPHKWRSEFDQWQALGGTLDKACLDAFEQWYDHKDDPDGDDDDE